MPDVGSLDLLLVVFVALPLWLLPAFFVGRFAERRGQRFAPFFLLSLVISWIVVLIGLLVITQPGTPDEAPTPQQPVGAWGVTPDRDAFAHDDRGDGEPRG